MDGDNPQVLRLLLFLTTDIPRSFSEITYHLELTKDDAVALLACGTELGALYSINGHWIIRNTASVKCVMMFLKSRPTIKGCKLKTLRSTRLDEFMSPEFLESKRRKEK